MERSRISVWSLNSSHCGSFCQKWQMCDIPIVKGPETKYKTQFTSKELKSLYFTKYQRKSWRRIGMNPQMDKLVRRTTIVATITASYFLLTADYGSEPNVLDPIKKAIKSAETSVKDFMFGSKTQPPESKVKNLGTNSAKDHP